MEKRILLNESPRPYNTETTEEFIQRLKDEYQRNLKIMIQEPSPKIKETLLNIIKLCCYIRENIDCHALTQEDKMKVGEKNDEN